MTKAHDTLQRYLTYAADHTSDGLNSDSPLAIEANGKYIDVLLATGGPHFDVQFQYEDPEAAEYWFENEPTGGVAHFADWGESDYVGMSRDEATRLAAALTREPPVT